MKYLVIGAGGTGGCIGAYMAQAGKDVTLIARGAHLKAMQENGLKMESTSKGSFTINPVKATDMEHYDERPDVIFVCVKGYSLDETIPFIRRIAKPESVVIPVLNIYGTGGRMQKELPDILVTDGCIYIVGLIKEPGCLVQNGDLFKVVFGVREASEYRPILADVKKDLEDSGITCVLSDNIRKDAMRKFSYISPAAACGQYYHAASDDIQKPGEIRETFKALIGEVMALSKAMGIVFEEDMVETNLSIMDTLAPGIKTSMQRDVEAGKNSELDGLVYAVARMGDEYGVPVPMYKKISDKLQREV